MIVLGCWERGYSSFVGLGQEKKARPVPSPSEECSRTSHAVTVYSSERVYADVSPKVECHERSQARLSGVIPATGVWSRQTATIQPLSAPSLCKLKQDMKDLYWTQILPMTMTVVLGRIHAIQPPALPSSRGPTGGIFGRTDFDASGHETRSQPVQPDSARVTLHITEHACRRPTAGVLAIYKHLKPTGTELFVHGV